MNRYANLTPMSTLIISVPTMNSNSVTSFDMIYHFLSAVRAADPESISAQFARPGRPMPSSLFNNLIGAATRSDSGDVDVAKPVAPDDDEVPLPDAHMFTPLVQERPQQSSPQPTKRHRIGSPGYVGETEGPRTGGPPGDPTVSGMYEKVDWTPVPPFLSPLQENLWE